MEYGLRFRAADPSPRINALVAAAKPAPYPDCCRHRARGRPCRLGPFLELEEIAVVRDEGIVGFFGGQAHCGWIVLWRQAMVVPW